MNEKKIHPLVPEMKSELEQGRITRREFLRFASLLGVSAVTARFLAGCAPQETSPTAAPVIATNTIAPSPTATPVPSVNAAVSIALLRGFLVWTIRPDMPGSKGPI